MDTGDLIIALCILAHAAAGRVPQSLWQTIIACVIYALAIVLVLLYLWRTVHL